MFSTTTVASFPLIATFTLYFGLIDSVPTPWKLAIRTTSPHVAENDKNFHPKLYSVILKNVSLPSTAESKIVRHCFTQDNIHRVYELPFRIKSSIKTKMFHYEIIHKKLVFLKPTYAMKTYAPGIT